MILNQSFIKAASGPSRNEMLPPQLLEGNDQGVFVRREIYARLARHGCGGSPSRRLYSRRSSTVFFRLLISTVIGPLRFTVSRT